jgi:diguanylate cyclase (GGDEF)-like protein/PAS domain S-box-containing protein
MKVRHKITLTFGAVVSIGLVALAGYYIRHQEEAVLAQNERTMAKLTESVSQGLQALMLSGYADIAQSFAERLKAVPDVHDFRILRTNGDEAFHDNATIAAVNRQLGRQVFRPRPREDRVPVLPADDADLLRTIATQAPVAVYGSRLDGERTLSFLAPIKAIDVCGGCHDAAEPVRGVIRLTTSLAPVERELELVQRTSVVVLIVALLTTISLTGFMLGHTVVTPLERITAAMARVASGDLSRKVPVESDDELGRMATSFNRMTSELAATYDGLHREQDKLTTIIHGVGEGIVVTDGSGRVVLANPAAERLLGRDAGQIAAAGFEALIDAPETIRGLLAGDLPAPHTVEYRGRVLQLQASTISGDDGRPVGSAALLRDVTEEKRYEEMLRLQSSTDALTGLYNRRHLDETLAIEFHRAVRTGTALSVLMLDIDHFKHFNDLHGHDQGDRVLQAVALSLRKALRKYDTPCRYGGEEFVAILPDTDGGAALGVGERLRRDVEARRVDGLQVTISIGIASTPELAVDTPEALFEAVDRALYQSKNDGRNRTTLARC